MTQRLQQVKNKIDAPARNVIRPGLSRTFTLLERMGNPQNHLNGIHVAGTNGKGSVCAMLESVLRTAGYRTGLYTSPHLKRANEEIRVSGTEISDAAYEELMARTLREAEAMTDPPTRFEITTAAALTYFYEQGCDLVIMEAGMGGAQDATNVIPPPEVCVITNIGLDHTAYLGDTPEQIAAQKAGIIKAGSHVVCYDLPADLRRVIDEAALRVGAPVRYADFGHLCEDDAGGAAVAEKGLSILRYRGRTYTVNLSGIYQKRNTAVVLETVGALRERGWEIPQEAEDAGLRSVQWPARFEVLREEPLLILDGGHNPQCAAAFAESLSRIRPGRCWRIVLGVLRDKEYETVVDLLLPQTEELICLTPENERALPAQELSDVIRSHLHRQGRRADVRVTAFGSIDEGMRALRQEKPEESPPTAVFGSLYLAGPVREWWTSHKNDG